MDPVQIDPVQIDPVQIDPVQTETDTPTPDLGIPTEEPVPSNTPSASPTARPTSLDLGTDVVVGGIPVLRLQGSEFTSDVRAQSVAVVIEQFMTFEDESNSPEIEIRAIQDSNLQYTLAIGERNNFDNTQQYLFTVTYADAAAVRGIPEARLSDVQLVANQWALQLERAIESYRAVRLDELRGQDPVVFTFSLISAAAILMVGFFVWRLARRSIHLMEAWLDLSLGESWHTWVDVGSLICRSVMAVVVALTSLHLAISTIPALRTLQRTFYFQLGRVFQTAFGVLTQPLPNSTLSIASLIVFAILTALVFVMAHYVSLGLKDRFLTRLGLDLGTQEASATVFKYSLTVLGMLLVLPFSGLNLSSLAVVVGSLALGIGLGLQNIFTDYVSYVAILVERPIQVGDLIEVNQLLGTVERIYPRATVVRTLDRVFVIVPNSQIIDQNVINWSYRDPRCRIHIPVGVAYGSDAQEVKETLLQAAKQHPLVLSTPDPQVFMSSFGNSAINFELLVWINRPQDQFVLKSDLNFAIELAFRRHNITIPFPQQDLHIRSAEGLREFFDVRHQHNGDHRPTSNLEGRIILPRSNEHRQDARAPRSHLTRPDLDSTDLGNSDLELN
ncbi:MAG: mechanosensitive ion channel [Synechococcaceae cyanobacterium SM2_3_2]|nr:mechanosensitive ion channel [Synechococcaceae cyanobacterium SM2_3_2]